MDEDFRKAALDYHRLPRPGKLAVEPTKRMATPARPGARLLPRRRRRLRGDRRRSRRRARLHRARQPGRGDLQRHRRARPGQYRPARRQAGDGGQGRPVQEIRRHRRVRHRGGRSRTRTGSATWSPRWSRPSARSTWKTSRRPSASRSRPNCARAWRSRCSTTTSTAPPSRSPPRCATGCCCRARRCDEVQAGHLRRRCRGAGLRRSAGGDGAAARRT